jgi:hypothetical protein
MIIYDYTRVQLSDAQSFDGRNVPIGRRKWGMQCPHWETQMGDALPSLGDALPPIVTYSKLKLTKSQHATTTIYWKNLMCKISFKRLYIRSQEEWIN